MESSAFLTPVVRYIGRRSIVLLVLAAATVALDTSTAAVVRSTLAN